MGISMEYNPDIKALVTILSGIVSLADLVQHNLHVESTLSSEDVQLRIMDLRALEQATLNADDISALARLNRQVIDAYPVKSMLVLTKSDLQYGLCRMWEAYAGIDEDLLHIFRSRKDACDWLRIKHGIDICIFKPQTVENSGIASSIQSI